MILLGLFIKLWETINLLNSLINSYVMSNLIEETKEVPWEWIMKKPFSVLRIHLDLNGNKFIPEKWGIKSKIKYQKFIDNHIYLSKEDLNKVTLPEITEGILRMRNGKVHVTPGFDGQHGVIKIFEDSERKDFQNKLF